MKRCVGGVVAAVLLQLARPSSAQLLLASPRNEPCGNLPAPQSHQVQVVSNESDSDCVLSEWLLGPCDPATLMAHSTRSVVSPASGRGSPCGETSTLKSCKPVHCSMSPWTEWGACDPYGYQVRTRSVVMAPSGGGRACPFAEDRVTCARGSCLVSPWGEWTCDRSTNEQTRARRVVQARTSEEGEPCPPLVERATKCRKPKAAWRGYYIQRTITQTIAFASLEVDEATGRISGSGRDVVGAFILNGTIDQQRRVVWIKAYASHSVKYEGESNGVEIKGSWHVACNSDVFVIQQLGG